MIFSFLKQEVQVNIFKRNSYQKQSLWGSFVISMTQHVKSPQDTKTIYLDRWSQQQARLEI